MFVYVYSDWDNDIYKKIMKITYIIILTCVSLGKTIRISKKSFKTQPG